MKPKTLFQSFNNPDYIKYIKDINSFIFPNGIKINPVNMKLNDSDDIINEIIFRPDVELMKNFFMLSIQPTENQIEERSKILKNCNPEDKLYFVGVKLKDYFCKKGEKINSKFVFLSDIAICVASRFPFFEFHRKILMHISSKFQNSYLQRKNEDL